MLARYVVRELVRNPRRSVVSLMGVTLSIGLFSAVLFFVDGSSASMTSRALAPLAIDMQRVLASPLGKGLTLTESVSTAGSLRHGETTTVTLELRNRGSEPVHDVVVKDEPPVPLTYVGGSTTVGGRAVRDVEGSPPLAHGPARLGLNLGTVDVGASIRLAYRARADRAVPEVGALRLRAMVSSRENPLPSPANSAAQLGLTGLAKRIGRLPGVAAADPLAFVDLPAGALRAHGVVVDHPVRVFGFGSGYGAHHSGIRLVRGSRRSGSALMSAEAARATGAGPGSTVTLRLPGGHPPLQVTVGGITDLSRARSLFYSRQSSNLEKFLYVPDSVVLDLPTFQRTVLPAFRAEQSRVGAELKTTPFLELDVSVRRADLQADPASALAQTRALAARVRQVGQGRDYLIDNISNTLAVAADDAVVAKKMFLFLGLPAGLLAAFLTLYTANVLATTTRRETAVLRLRGATRRHLTTLLLYRSLAVAGAGSVLGCLLGLLSAAAVLGPAALFRASAGDLLFSACIGVLAGVVTTTLTAYAAARRLLRTDVRPGADESVSRRRWSRWVAVTAATALLVTTAAEVLLARSGVFETVPGSVYEGRGVSLPTPLLSVPVAAWVFGVTVAVLVLSVALSALPVPKPPAFGPLTLGTLLRTLKRRSASVSGAVAALGLIVGFSVALATFGATYDSAKSADSRFLLGSDLRVTPSVTSGGLPASSASARLAVPGVTVVTPLVAGSENALASGPYGQEREDLAAVDPSSFRDATLPAGTPANARPVADDLGSLARDPRGVLISRRAAESLQVGMGDRLPVLLARNTRHQAQARLRVVGLIEQFPAFPQGVDLVMNRSFWARTTGVDSADFFLVSTGGAGPDTSARVAGEIRSRPLWRSASLVTSQTALDKDQSSLTALNVSGLIGLDFAFTLAMVTGVVGIFVFGLLLQRRKEFVTLRALGMQTRETVLLVVAETGTVAALGLAAGLLVGYAMAILLVQALRALFVLDPALTMPVGTLLAVAGLGAVMTLVASAGAVALLARMRPTEVLRET